MTSITKPIIVISDPEGYDMETMYEKPEGEFDLYICGDLTDSTFNPSESITPNNTIKYEKITKITKSKIYNLRNIYNVIKNDNYHLIFGNRDLNKMKCLLLCELNNKTTDEKNKTLYKEYYNEVDNFNNGDIILNYETYNKLKVDDSKQPYPLTVLYNDDKKDNFWEHSMVNWYPFWNTDNIYNKGKIDYWDVNNPKNTKSIFYFSERFDKIFGTDTMIGTMSAGDLLETIINELIDVGYEELKKDINTINKNFNGPIKENVLKDFKSFIVLAIYRSMLLKNENVNTITDFKINLNNIETNKHFYKSIKTTGMVYSTTTHYLSSKFCKGWLYKLFTRENSNIIDFVKNELHKQMYLFSHGGLNNTIVRNVEKIITDIDKYLDETNMNYLTDFKKYSEYKTQIGGYYKDKNINKFKSEEVINNIKIYNQYIKDIINFIFDNYTNYETHKTDINKKLVILLILSSGFDSNKFNKNNPQTLVSTDISPIIMNGFDKLRNDDGIFVINDFTTYQFVGHSPYGYSSTIELYKNKNDNDKTILITLDISNSFLGSTMNMLNNNKNESINYVLINTDGFVYNKSKLNINIKESDSDDEFKAKINIFNQDTYLENIFKPKTQTDIYISNYDNTSMADKNKLTLELNTKIDSSLLKLIENTYGIIELNDNSKDNKLIINFNSNNGTIKTNNPLYVVTVSVPIYLQFNKTLFILTENDYKKLLNYYNHYNLANVNKLKQQQIQKKEEARKRLEEEAKIREHNNALNETKIEIKELKQKYDESSSTAKKTIIDITSNYDTLTKLIADKKEELTKLSNEPTELNIKLTELNDELKKLNMKKEELSIKLDNNNNNNVFKQIEDLNNNNSLDSVKIILGNIQEIYNSTVGVATDLRIIYGNITQIKDTLQLYIVDPSKNNENILQEKERLEQIRKAEEAKRKEEAERQRQAEEERKRKEAEAKRQAEEERKRQEAEAKRLKEEAEQSKETGKICSNPINKDEIAKLFDIVPEASCSPLNINNIIDKIEEARKTQGPISIVETLNNLSSDEQKNRAQELVLSDPANTFIAIVGNRNIPDTFRNAFFENLSKDIATQILQKFGQPIGLLGGSRVNSDYKFKNKYLKYKTKYLELQQEMKMKKLYP